MQIEDTKETGQFSILFPFKTTCIYVLLSVQNEFPTSKELKKNNKQDRSLYKLKMIRNHLETLKNNAHRIKEEMLKNLKNMQKTNQDNKIQDNTLLTTDIISVFKEEKI